MPVARPASGNVRAFPRGSRRGPLRRAREPRAEGAGPAPGRARRGLDRRGLDQARAVRRGEQLASTLATGGATEGDGTKGEAERLADGFEVVAAHKAPPAASSARR